jgi:WD40 repeat protein
LRGPDLVSRPAAGGGSTDRLATPVGGLNCLQFSPDALGQYLAAGAAGGEVLLWETATRTLRPVTLPTRRPITAIALSTDGWLAAGGAEQHVLAWDIANSRAKKLPIFPAPITAIQNRPQSSELVVALSNGELNFVNLQSGKIDKLAGGHGGGIKTLAFNPAGTQLVTGGTDGKLIWRDAKTRQVFRTVEAHTHEISSVAFAPDGLLFVSGSWDGSAKLWTASDGTLQAELPHPDAVSCVGCTPTQVVTGCWDGKLRFWPYAGGSPTAEFETGEALHALAVHPRGDVVATVAQGPVVQFWKSPR